MTEKPDGLGPLDDELIQELFDKQLHTEPLPAEFSERLVLQVLAEVEVVYAPTTRLDQPVQPSVGRLERLRNWLGNLRPMQALGVAGAGALVVMLLFIGLSRIVPRPISAVATVTGGDITVLRQFNESFRVYHEGDVFKLQQGDQVIAQNGSAAITAFPSQVAVVEPGGHVEIALLDDMNGGTQVEYFVYSGELRSTIDEQLDAVDNYVVNSPLLSTSVSGTDFSVETVSNTETRVATYEGAVSVEMDGQVVTVSAGQQLDAKEGQPLIVKELTDQPGSNTLLIISAAPYTPVNLYASPSAGGAVIGQVKSGVVLDLVDQDASGQWFNVCCLDGQSGWIGAASLEVTATPQPEATPTTPPSTPEPGAEAPDGNSVEGKDGALSAASNASTSPPSIPDQRQRVSPDMTQPTPVTDSSPASSLVERLTLATGGTASISATPANAFGDWRPRPRPGSTHIDAIFGCRSAAICGHAQSNPCRSRSGHRDLSPPL